MMVCYKSYYNHEISRRIYVKLVLDIKSVFCKGACFNPFWINNSKGIINLIHLDVFNKISDSIVIVINTEILYLN